MKKTGNLVLVIVLMLAGIVFLHAMANVNSVVVADEPTFYKLVVVPYRGRPAHVSFPSGGMVGNTQSTVVTELTEFVNAGTHNIVQVVTEYQLGCLIAAQVDYRQDESIGAGNKLRVSFALPSVAPNKVDCLPNPSAQAAALLLASGSSNLRRLNKIAYRGQQTAVEVWYDAA